jgi:hypothetical protein
MLKLVTLIFLLASTATLVLCAPTSSELSSKELQTKMFKSDPNVFGLNLEEFQKYTGNFLHLASNKFLNSFTLLLNHLKRFG